MGLWMIWVEKLLAEKYCLRYADNLTIVREASKLCLPRRRNYYENASSIAWESKSYGSLWNLTKERKLDKLLLSKENDFGLK